MSGGPPAPPFDADAAYRAIIEAHRGLDAAASAALDARLVLALVLRLGDNAALVEILANVRAGPGDGTETLPEL